MPRAKSARSLYDTCLVYVSKNMSKFCTEPNVDGQADVVTAIDHEGNTTNPFDKLSSGLLEALIELITRKKFKRDLNKTERFLPQLITPHLSSLSLSTCPIDEEINLDYIIRLTAVRCKHLKTLRLGCYSQNYPDCLKFIPQFSYLQVLDVTKFEKKNFPPSITGDDLFHLLGIHCVNLRELCARDTQVTDAGIQGLCVIGNCKSIRILDLMRNPVTAKGIQMAVDNLPCLKLIFHRSIIEFLACIAQSASDQRLPSLPEYSLTALNLYSSVYRDGSLEKAILLCPFVTDLRILMNGKVFKNSELLALLSLKQLYILDIMHLVEIPTKMGDPFRYDEDLTFHGGVLPLLKRFGNSLKILELKGLFNDINISAVIELCPNLHSLILNKDYRLQWTKKVDWDRLETEWVPTSTVSSLKDLVKLDLRGVFSHQPFVSSEDLFKLLSSPLLKNVKLSHCNVKKIDEILERANNLHSFCYLESLIISHCNTVTKKGIDVFMQEKNPLRYISAHYCDKITSKDFIQWKKNPIWKKKNWQLEFYCDDF